MSISLDLQPTPVHSSGMRSNPHAFTLPRAIRYEGRTTTLQQALRRGADPLALEVEDGAGGWQPYIEPRPLPPPVEVFW